MEQEKPSTNAAPSSSPCPICEYAGFCHYYGGTCTRECAQALRLVEVIKDVAYQIWAK